MCPNVLKLSSNVNECEPLLCGCFILIERYEDLNTFGNSGSGYGLPDIARHVIGCR
jgi:hypothetical protein